MKLVVQYPPLHPGQLQVFNCAARFIVVAAGRRWGKTRLGTVLCLHTALSGGVAWWVAPTYRMAQVGWDLIAGMARQLGGLAELRYGDQQVKLINGGRIMIRSADEPDRLRGVGLDLVVVDEAAHMRDLNMLWEQILRPTLADRQGRALFISTPCGMNAFYDLFRRGADGTPGWTSFQFPSWDNPHLPAEEVEAMRQQMPALVFRQECAAEFVQVEGALFRREWFTIVDERPAARYVRSWDLAVTTKTVSDYTCGVLVGMQTDGTVVIADVVRGRWEWPDVVRVIANTARSDGASVVQGIEVVGTQAGVLQTLRRERQLADIAFRPLQVHADKITRVMPWLARAEQGKIALVRGAWNSTFLDEVCAFPEGQHDDQVDAVSGAMQMLAWDAYRWVR